MLHWTYAPIEPSAQSELEQGDILIPTAEFRSILAEVHPHFATDKYHAFIVTTQSCDLVVRGGKGPRARYISVAAVRPLRSVIPRLLEGACSAVPLGSAKVLPISRRIDAQELLERILNQNEQALGLFYLHPDSDIRLVEECVAFLRVTVSLRAEHYGILTAARTGRLSPEFRAKLGWLVGNLYSRAAAPDWGDQVGGTEKQKELIRDLIKEDPERRLWWIDDELVSASKSAKVKLEGDDVEAHKQRLETLRPKRLSEQIVAEVQKQIVKIVRSPPALAERKRQIREILERCMAKAVGDDLLEATSNEVATSVDALIEGLIDNLTEKIAGRLGSSTVMAALRK